MRVKALQEVGALLRAHQVAHQGETHADAGGGTVHRGHHRHLQVAQTQENGMIGGAQTGPGSCAPIVAAFVVEIGAGGKTAPHAGEQQAARAVGFVLDIQQRLGKFRNHLGADGVQDLWVVEI